MIYIKEIADKPLANFNYLNAGRRPNCFFVDRLPVLRATVEGLPDSLDAIVVTADLQGRETANQTRKSPNTGQLRLLGEVLPEMLKETLDEIGAPSSGNIGAFLCGDFYTYEDLRGRGGTGDVNVVWHTFRDSYRWTAGVAGNHDTFGNKKKFRRPSFGEHCRYLDGDCVEFDKIKVGGVSGVIGNPAKNQRKTLVDYIENLELVLMEKPDVVLLHEGPDAPDEGYRGVEEITRVLEKYSPPLVVRGHKHWPKPLVELGGGTQVLNVEATVAILCRA